MTKKTFMCLAAKTWSDENFGLLSIPDCSFTILPDMPEGFRPGYIGSYKTDAFFALFSASDDYSKVFKKIVVYSTATDKWITRIDDADAFVNEATGREDLVVDIEHYTIHRYRLYHYYGEHRFGILVKTPEGDTLLVGLSTETWEVVETTICPKYFLAAHDDWFVYEGDVFLKTDIQNPIASFTEAHELIGISDDGTTMVFDRRGNYPDWIHTFIVVNTNDWSYKAYETELVETGAYRPDPTAEMLYFLHEDRIYNRQGKLVNTIGFEGSEARMHRDSDVVANITYSPTGFPSIVTLYNPFNGDIVSTGSIDDFYVELGSSGPSIGPNGIGGDGGGGGDGGDGDGNGDGDGDGGDGDTTPKNFWTGFFRAIEVI